MSVKILFTACNTSPSVGKGILRATVWPMVGGVAAGVGGPGFAATRAALAVAGISMGEQLRGGVANSPDRSTAQRSDPSELFQHRQCLHPRGG